MVHLPDGAREQTAKRARERRTREEERKASLRLISPIPHPDQVEAAREHARLRQAQEETRGQQPAVAAYQSLTNAHQPEEEHAPAQPHVWLEPLQQQVGGNLKKHVRHEEDGERGVELRAAHVQVAGQAEDGRIGDVDAVDEGEKIEHGEDRDDAQVDLGRQLLLGGWRERRRPHVFVVVVVVGRLVVAIVCGGVGFLGIRVAGGGRGRVLWQRWISCVCVLLVAGTLTSDQSCTVV